MKKRSFVLSITEELRNKVKADAAMKSISMNAWITEAIEKKLVKGE